MGCTANAHLEYHSGGLIVIKATMLLTVTMTIIVPTANANHIHEP